MPVDPYPGVPTPNTLADATKMRGQLDALFSPVVPRCRVYQAIDSAVSHDTLATVPFGSESYDTNGMHSTSVNTSRITIATAGVYRFTAQGVWQANATGTRSIKIWKNGTVYVAGAEGPGQATYSTALIASCELACSVSDYFEVIVYQTSGGNLNLLYTSDYSPVFSACFISA